MDIQFQDVWLESPVLDSGDGAVTRRTQVGTHELPQSILLDAVIVVWARLHNVVPDPSAWPMQDMPVAQDVWRTGVLVVDDAADSSGRLQPVCHAGARDNRVD